MRLVGPNCAAAGPPETSGPSRAILGCGQPRDVSTISVAQRVWLVWFGVANGFCRWARVMPHCPNHATPQIQGHEVLNQRRVAADRGAHVTGGQDGRRRPKAFPGAYAAWRTDAAQRQTETRWPQTGKGTECSD
eukprot:scaffold6319_cov107-Isochrysis_galbana.AAC.5